MKLPKHMPQLDAVRGVAVLYVMFYHCAKNVPALHLQWWFRYGFTGVDLFFVLSGFLITGILLNSKGDPRYFQNFYARRILRIWPLYYALLLLMFGVLPLLQPALKAQIMHASGPLGSYPAFVQNFFVGEETFGPVQLTWSLAIEEQFYLVWPVLVFLWSEKRLSWAAGSTVVFSLALRVADAAHLLRVDTYHNTFARLDAIAIGALLALWIPRTKSQTVRRLGVLAFALGLMATSAIELAGQIHWIFNLTVAICAAGLVCYALTSKWLAAVPWLRYTGKISYGLYLLHCVAFDIIRNQHVRGLLARSHNELLNQFVLLVASMALAYGLASASWWLLEQPILRLKGRFAPQPAPKAQREPEQAMVAVTS